MILLDTTVLHYAVGEPHRFRAPSRRLIDANADGSVAAATTIEVVQEFAHTRSRRRSRADAAALARDYATTLRIISTDHADLDLGLDIFEQHPALGSFDAVLAAVAINRGLEALISADRAFGGVRGLRWIDLGGKELEELLEEPDLEL